MYNLWIKRYLLMLLAALYFASLFHALNVFGRTIRLHVKAVDSTISSTVQEVRSNENKTLSSEIYPHVTNVRKSSERNLFNA